ncbi:MAG: hypothetical protein ABIF10_01050 [Candidatus Woesearchaeota archaeon]
MDEPKTLSFEEIAKIPLEDLVTSRELQRNIDFTIHQDRTLINGTPKNPAPSVMFSNRTRTVVEPYTFLTCDKGFIYYFPRDIPNGLRQEPIPSGIFVPNLEKDSLARALTYFKPKNTFYTIIESFSTGVSVKRKIDSEYTLRQAIECGNTQAIEAVGTVELPFDKPLCRVRTFGRYAHLPQHYDMNKWQEFGDLFSKPQDCRNKATR